MQQALTKKESIAPLLTTGQAAAWLGYTERMLEARRLRGGGPKYVRISARAVRYRFCDLENFVESCLRSSTSDP